MVQKILVVSNPVSGKASEAYVAGIIRALESSGYSVEQAETTVDGSVNLNGKIDAEIVLAIGGDGTIRDVVNNIGIPNYALAIAPAGTANVFAAEIGQTANIDDIVNTIVADNRVPLNLGYMREEHFSVMAGVGFDADVVHSVNLKWKRRVGKLAYALAAVKALWRYRPRSFAVTIDGKQYVCEAVIFSNSHFYGGKFICAATARVTEPLLHACLITAGNRWDIVKFAIAMVRGRLHQFENVRFVPGTDFEITDPGLSIQCDGDAAGKTPMKCQSYTAPNIQLLIPTNCGRSH